MEQIILDESDAAIVFTPKTLHLYIPKLESKKEENAPMNVQLPLALLYAIKEKKELINPIMEAFWEMSDRVIKEAADGNVQP